MWGIGKGLTSPHEHKGESRENRAVVVLVPSWSSFVFPDEHQIR
jgi:hypothetical protein